MITSSSVVLRASMVQWSRQAPVELAWEQPAHLQGEWERVPLTTELPPR